MQRGDVANMAATAVVLSCGLRRSMGMKMFCSTVPRETEEGLELELELEFWWILQFSCSSPTGQVGRNFSSVMPLEVYVPLTNAEAIPANWGLM